MVEQKLSVRLLLAGCGLGQCASEKLRLNINFPEFESTVLHVALLEFWACYLAFLSLLPCL